MVIDQLIGVSKRAKRRRPVSSSSTKEISTKSRKLTSTEAQKASELPHFPAASPQDY